MPATIRLLDETESLQALPDLCEILADCVEGGASVGFMLPFAASDGEAFWRGVARSVGAGDVLLLVAEVDGRIEGTVQVSFAAMPNQPHRGDLKKLLVHRRARGLGLSRLLMQAAEREAAGHGRTLLVLDTATGEPAEGIYEKLGWSRAGVVPNYALFPDGRYCGTTFFFKDVAPAAT
ncbi:MAG: GNAT family N-acetyltransferase [Allorhizobium sp.]